MKSKLKYLIITLTVAAIAGVLLYVPFVSMAQSTEQNRKISEKETPEVYTLEAHVRCCWRKHHWRWWFLQNSYPVEIDGTAVGLWKGMLIVNTSEGNVRVFLPEMWTIDEEFARRGELFDEYLSVGEEITVKALRADITDNEGFNIYVMLGYEITNEAGVHAYAILPFNVEIQE